MFDYLLKQKNLLFASQDKRHNPIESKWRNRCMTAIQLFHRKENLQRDFPASQKATVGSASSLNPTEKIYEGNFYRNAAIE